MANTNDILYSTNYDSRYALENILPKYQLEFPDGSIQFKRDYMGSKIIRILKQIKNFSTYRYRGFEVITTLVNQAYGTTTPAGLVLMYNGIAHPLEIVPGTILKFPDLTPITDYLQRKNNVNNIGKVITI
jgi:hypothetical protein